LGVLDGDAPNLVRYTFCDPRARAAYPDWDAVAREQVAGLRATSHACGADDAGTLVGELRAASPEFARLWAEQDVAVPASGTTRLALADAGVVTLDFEVFL